jgi:hypothetical protein
LISAASLLAGTTAIVLPTAAVAGQTGIENAAGLEFAQRGDNRGRRGENRGPRRGDRMNSTRTSTEARVFTSPRFGGAYVNTRGEARASGNAWSSSEGDVYSRTDADGSEADAYGRSEAEALQRVRRERPE